MKKQYNIKPRLQYFFNGGTIVAKKQPSYMNNRESVRAILQVGEIVIPKKQASTVVRMLKSRNIRLPNT